eukprot:sb/3478436/
MCLTVNTYFLQGSSLIKNLHKLNQYQEPTEASKQPIRARNLDQPIRDQYFLIRSVPDQYLLLQDTPLGTKQYLLQQDTPLGTCDAYRERQLHRNTSPGVW